MTNLNKITKHIVFIMLLLSLFSNNLLAQKKKGDLKDNKSQPGAIVTTLDVSETLKFPVVNLSDQVIADRINVYLKSNYGIADVDFKSKETLVGKLSANYGEINYKVVNNTQNILTIEIEWSSGRAWGHSQYHFDLSTGYSFTLDQIILPSKWEEIKQMICNDSKKRLSQVKNKVIKDMENGRGGWSSANKNLWYQKGDWGENSYEENYQIGMGKDYFNLDLGKEFDLSKDGIVFHYIINIGFPMSVANELEPSNEYFYKWSVLRPFLMSSSPITSLIK